MFVKWQSRKRTKPAFGKREWVREPYRRYAHGTAVRADTGQPDVCWTADLTKSVRVDGKPRQKYVTRLGSINESEMQDVDKRCAFWRCLRSVLKREKIKEAERDKIEASVSRKVPKPTASQMAKHEVRVRQSQRRFNAAVKRLEALERGSA